MPTRRVPFSPPEGGLLNDAGPMLRSQSVRQTVVGLLLAVSALLSLPGQAEAQPTLYIVRHAEKVANWPGGELDIFHPLSDAGVRRARRLADLFASGSLAAIYTSRTTRTIHTALPVAEKLGLQIEVAEACMDTSAIDTFYAQLRKRFAAGQAVLLVSHSNIIPYLLLRAGLPNSCREAMGITPSKSSRWLLIQGYDSVWKIDRLGDPTGDCSRFHRIRF